MRKKWIKHVGLLFVVFCLIFNPASVAPVYAFNAPGLLSPSNGATITVIDTPPLAIPEFRWTAVTDATKYRLQVSSDIGFTSLLINITTSNTSYTPVSVTNFSDGLWYWRVRVDSPAPVSEYSTIWSFTKRWADPANAPALISPANSATLDFYDNPGFSWGAVAGAAEYKLQIYASSGGWGTPVYSTTTLQTTHQPTTKLTNGVYYWRVVPLDAVQHAGTPSVERTFSAAYNFVPTLLEPEDFSNPTFTPTFRWTAVRGAEVYRLQYSTDPTFTTSTTAVATSNTTYTPLTPIPNDVNYYWRVRAESGNSISNWTESRTFLKKWYITPVLLTPVNNYQHVRFPIFSWTPVPGAAYYKVEISKSIGFNPIFDSGTTANTFFSPSKYDGAPSLYYWRVTPYDGANKPGITSDSASYYSYSGSVAPQQIYPFHYYPIDVYVGAPGVTMNPHEDRTVPSPIFIWHRVYVPALVANAGQMYADAYRLEVSTDATFSSVDWTIDTENTVAIPNADHPFTPVANIDYFWRVRPLIDGTEVGEWSQIWKVHFDPARGLTPVVGTAPTLTRPTSGFEFAEMTPLLEWVPLSGAASYDVEISRDEAFSDVVDSANVSYPAYVSTQSLAQRSLNATDFGVYYWRVRQSPGGAWSEVRRFQISAQSQWRNSRTLGAAANQLQIGSDPGGDVPADYDLTNLQVAQSSTYWYFGFAVPSAPTQNVTYALYLDTNHQDASGATTDARGYTVSTISAFRPEFAIYVLQEAGAFSATKTYIYRWNGIGWDTVSVLNTVGGQLSKSGNYVELAIPNTTIGYQVTTGSYAVSLLSLPASNGQPAQDSVPSDPAIPGAGPISRFANVTERMNLLLPPNDTPADTTAYPSILPFYWDWPVLAPWSGAIMKAYLDPLFTNQAQTYTLTSDTAYYAQTSHAWGDDFSGDNTYYWRIQPRYRDGTCALCLGAWSQGWRFDRQGFIPKNLQTSITFATPTFTWDLVEGAASYDLQVDNDPNFGSPAINAGTTHNSYTNTNTLANGTYYWRVRVNRDGGVLNNWSTTQNFTISLPVPSGLNHSPAGVVAKAPTLRWTPLIMNSLEGDPVLAAYKYKFQVSKDNTFSTIFETVDTEQSSWTPIKGYDDGTYYWHVAMIDGQGNVGSYSATQTFTKQYPITSLVSPTSGTAIGSTPTFIWTNVNGAKQYKLEVSRYSTFTPLFDSEITVNNRWTPTKEYTSLGTYYWRVAIVDADGKTGPFVGATIILSDGKSIGVYIGSSPSPVGTYNLDIGQSLRQSYDIDNGPAKITNSNGNPLIASLRINLKKMPTFSSYSEIMGIPEAKLSDTYIFPWYNNANNSGLASQLRFGNVGNAPTTVTIKIGGVTQVPSYTLAPNESMRVSYTDMNNGPVEVKSSNGVPIIAALRINLLVNPSFTSYAEFLGLSASASPATRYIFPWYNNAINGGLDSQLRFGNVGNATTVVTLKLGGVIQQDTYTLAPNESVRVTLPNVDNGPVEAYSSNGVPIIASIRVNLKPNPTYSSYTELMGLPGTTITATRYLFPWYNNTGLLDSQLRFGNVGNAPTTVTIKIAGVAQVQTYTLAPNESARVSLPNIDSGPVEVVSSGGVPIIASMRVNLKTNPTYASYTEFMGMSVGSPLGLPGNELSTTYWFPWYNNAATGGLNSQLRFGVP